MNRNKTSLVWPIQLGVSILLLEAISAQNLHGQDPSPSMRKVPTSGTNNVSWSGVATNSQGATIAIITVNTTETPDLVAWGRRAGELCAEWYPKIATLLASEGFEPPKLVRIDFHPDKEGVADTANDTITIAANYVRRATNDFGMLIHELTHVVQSYGHKRNPGWLVEGVADYIRLTHFEPQASRPRINPDRASYRDAYKTTAIFLEWAERKYDANLVSKLNRAMREGNFKIELFQTCTGHSVDQLWREFTDTLRAKEKSAGTTSN